MTVLITGGKGMLGSAIKRAMSKNEMHSLAPGRDELNLEDYHKVRDYLATNKVTKVIHCAALVGGIKLNIERGADLLIRNLQIDSNILRASQDLGINELIYISSSCSYPIDAVQPFKESNLKFGNFEPTNKGYAIAKMAGVESVISINRQNKLAYRALVLSNLYGPNDNFFDTSAHLVSAAIMKCYEAVRTNRTTVEIWGSGKPRREFTYVEDVAEWISRNVEGISYLPEILNLGCGRDYTILEFYKAAAETVGFKGDFKMNLEMPDGIHSKLMDSSLARDKHGWSASTDLKNGLASTYEWWTKRKGVRL